ncbi:E3 ubiquitin-protein ligase MARCHF1 [Taenia crassiceps]|uniref:E3 ubiquitin-protein ligase MARCHF1 n=1 Tax=Taenia crassiceps TaxID=6207 RepID=A0ABR4QAU9_9CEST
MDEKLQHNGLNELEGTGNYKYEDSDIGPHHAVEAVEEESRQSRGCNGSSGVRFASLLRSSLRLSTSTKKTPKSTSSSTISTASLSSQPVLGEIGSFRSIGSAISVSSYGFLFCRICHESNESTNAVEFNSYGRLIAPCLCDGSLKYVHEKCIQQWIEISQSKKCELCHFEYETRKYTKPMKEWKFFSLEWRDLRKLFCFVTIYVLIQACVAWALYALISNLTSTGTSNSERNWQFWLKVFVVLVGMFSVGVFAYVQTRYCCEICQRWRRLNRVCVVREPPKERIAKMRMEQRVPTSRLCIVHEVDTFTAIP